MFDHFISLGLSCPMAGSMSKYGLRSCSGPFDWLVTVDLGWVLYHIDTDFKEFLLQENLESYNDNPLHFRDKLSGFVFLHEKLSFRDEYIELKCKYDRRIDKFLKITQSKVCYLRRIDDENDIAYIEKNADYIRRVIYKHNSESEIVFLCDEILSVPDNFPFMYFKMKEQWTAKSRSALRGYFDYAEDFLAFCGENYAGAKLMKNLMFDYKKEEPRINLFERRYKTLTKLLIHEFTKDTFSDEVIIYGAGVIGMELYKRIKECTKVKCFVDKKKAGETFDNVEIISVDELQRECGIQIIVSATYDLENIKSKLYGKYRDEDIISLDDILGLVI